MNPEQEELPTSGYVVVNSLQELLAGPRGIPEEPVAVGYNLVIGTLDELLERSRDIPAPLDDKMILGRVILSEGTKRRMERKAKLNKRFKRNRTKKVGRPKTHYKHKQKLKKANNKRNYMKRTKPKLERLKADRLKRTDISLPPKGEEGI